MNPLAMWQGMNRNDRYFLMSTIAAPLIVWWVYQGRKYSMKGMK